jgi:hypothetical protein
MEYLKSKSKEDCALIAEALGGEDTMLGSHARSKFLKEMANYVYAATALINVSWDARNRAAVEASLVAGAPAEDRVDVQRSIKFLRALVTSVNRRTLLTAGNEDLDTVSELEYLIVLFNLMLFLFI